MKDAIVTARIIVIVFFLQLRVGTWGLPDSEIFVPPASFSMEMCDAVLEV